MSLRSIDSAERGNGPFIWRFSRMDRILHLMVVVSFFGLVLTGLPLHFAGEPWARFLVDLHGGVKTAGIIHRICAVITFAYFILHLGTLAVRIARSSDRGSFFWGPDSLVPQPKDLRDIRDMFKWFVGRGPRPRFDRFSYLEKFDYWAVFWGVGIIGLSGLLLWFPEFFAAYVPGWMFNVATIVHGDEALLALCFIFVVHFFNGQLRPGKFPLDLVIFTGRATAEYLEEEHPLEMERAERSGTLRQRMADPPPALLVT
ncbi:MAG: cytochrome C, partial [Gemmatimonadetes bacterium]|nr:cytochrome C [Gemmatimonadota bacterium]